MKIKKSFNIKRRKEESDEVQRDSLENVHFALSNIIVVESLLSTQVELPTCTIAPEIEIEEPVANFPEFVIPKIITYSELPVELFVEPELPTCTMEPIKSISFDDFANFNHEFKPQLNEYLIDIDEVLFDTNYLDLNSLIDDFARENNMENSVQKEVKVEIVSHNEEVINNFINQNLNNFFDEQEQTPII